MFYGIQHSARRRTLALLLSLLMIASTAAPAFADLFAFESVTVSEPESVSAEGELRARSGDYEAEIVYGADAQKKVAVSGCACTIAPISGRTL